MRIGLKTLVSSLALLKDIQCRELLHSSVVLPYCIIVSALYVGLSYYIEHFWPEKIDGRCCHCRDDAGRLVRTERLRTKDITQRVKMKNYWQVSHACGNSLSDGTDSIACFLPSDAHLSHLEIELITSLHVMNYPIYVNRALYKCHGFFFSEIELVLCIICASRLRVLYPQC